MMHFLRGFFPSYQERAAVERQRHYQEIAAKIGEVIPQLTQGDHTLARYLSQPKYLRLETPPVDFPTDQFRAEGESQRGDSYTIRLYGNQDTGQYQLQSILRPYGFGREIACSWDGGALGKVWPRLYVNLVDDISFSFNLDTLDLAVLSKYGQAKDYDLADLTVGGSIRPYFESDNGTILSRVSQESGVITMSLFRKKGRETVAALPLKLPAVITQLNLIVF